MGNQIKNNLASIGKLCGMIYAQGKYTAKEWEQKVGINPLQYSGYITVVNGKCFWTKKAETAYKLGAASTAANWNSLAC